MSEQKQSNNIFYDQALINKNSHKGEASSKEYCKYLVFSIIQKVMNKKKILKRKLFEETKKVSKRKKVEKDHKGEEAFYNCMFILIHIVCLSVDNFFKSTKY